MFSRKILTVLLVLCASIVIVGCNGLRQENVQLVEDYGIVVKGGMQRGIYATADADGRDCLVLWLMDNNINKRNIQIDAETGACTEAPLPFDNNGDAVYSSIMASTGKMYSHVCFQFVEYDCIKKEFTVHIPNAHRNSMSMYEDRDGVIWAGNYPDGGLVSYNPANGEFTDYGCINVENWPQYPRSLVHHSDGWVYVGIGETNGQIVAFNPETREAKPLVPEEKRPNPSKYTVAEYSDGNVYGNFDKFWFKLENGQCIALDAAPDATPLTQISGPQNYVYPNFPSGRKLADFRIMDGTFKTTDADGNDVKTVNFSFDRSGVQLMSIDVNEDGIAAGGSYFPFRFGTVNIADGSKKDEHCGEQCNAITAHGKYFYIGGYTGGVILRFDPSKPWDLESSTGKKTEDWDANPYFYGMAFPEITRPHCIAVSKDGSRLFVGGTPDYGLTGGGMGMVELETRKCTVFNHKQLIENESPFAFAPLSDGRLVVGTTTAAGTGGQVIADRASLYIFNPTDGKVEWKMDMPEGVSCVMALIEAPNGKVIGVDSTSTMFSFDPVTKEFNRHGSVAEYGNVVEGQAPRILLEDNGRIYMLLNKGIALLNEADCSIKKFMEIPGGITHGGGVYDGGIFFETNFHLKRANLKYFDMQDTNPQ